MILDNKQNISQATLACAAQLAADVMMRLSQNGVSGTDAGHYITRATVGSAALNTVRSHLLQS